MCSSEFMALKRAIAIEREHTVETFTFRVSHDFLHAWAARAATVGQGES